MWWKPGPRRTGRAGYHPSTLLKLYIYGYLNWVQSSQLLGSLSTQTVAIDGSKFKAVNNRDKNFTPEKMKRRQERVEKSIAKYLAALEKADRKELSLPAAETERLQARLAKLHEEMQRLEALKAQMGAAPGRQLSLTDADARSMK